MIEKPPDKEYSITGDQIWEILINAETQGGNKAMAYKINKILEEVVENRRKPLNTHKE